jgi:hypothetical protein
MGSATTPITTVKSVGRASTKSIAPSQFSESPDGTCTVVDGVAVGGTMGGGLPVHPPTIDASMTAAISRIRRPIPT